MLLVYLGLYTLFLVFIWGFFIIARIHALKFKNFSDHIENVFGIALFVLVILSIVGYVSIFFSGEFHDVVQVNPDLPSYSEIDY